jgi:hypothetical protein
MDIHAWLAEVPYKITIAGSGIFMALIKMIARIVNKKRKSHGAPLWNHKKVVNPVRGKKPF